MKESKIYKQGLKALNDMDSEKMLAMFKQFDKNFATLSENQVYIQENQVEFEKYLQTIIKNQESIIGLIKKQNGLSEHI